MKTEISRFCDDCLKIFESLPPALDAAAEHFEKSGDPALFRMPLTKLNDVRARLRSLVEKLGSQQAYLLIFGPLKSGKSTLMNAISGAYVSEVTSLPGYPCLVFVRNSESPQFSATRYNGRESVFANGRALKEVIEADSRGRGSWNRFRSAHAFQRGDSTRRCQAPGANPGRIRHGARGYAGALQPDEFWLRCHDP